MQSSQHIQKLYGLSHRGLWNPNKGQDQLKRQLLLGNAQRRSLFHTEDEFDLFGPRDETSPNPLDFVHDSNSAGAAGVPSSSSHPCSMRLLRSSLVWYNVTLMISTMPRYQNSEGLLPISC